MNDRAAVFIYRPNDDEEEGRKRREKIVSQVQWRRTIVVAEILLNTSKLKKAIFILQTQTIG